MGAVRHRRAHFWVLVAPERHVLYRYSHKHDSEAVDRLLAGYKGHLVADAHSVYDHLYQDGDLVALARRGWAMYAALAGKLAGGHTAGLRLRELMMNPGKSQGLRSLRD